MREVVSRCDVCGGDEDVTTYLVMFNGEAWEIDMDAKADAKHSKPLHFLLGKYARKRITDKPASTRAGIRALESRIRGVGNEPFRQEA